MYKLGTLLLLWAICEGIVTAEIDESDLFVQPLDFASLYKNGASLTSRPLSAAMIHVDKSDYDKLFDTVVSSSIDSIQKRVPRDHIFSAESFGFNPIASQGYRAVEKSAKLISPSQAPAHLARIQKLSPLYDIHTVHDRDYKVYKPDENEKEEEILAALKKNPAVSKYFESSLTNLEVAHPPKYRKSENYDNYELHNQNYKPNHYLPGPTRIRRYADRKREKITQASEEDEDEDPYDYKADYTSRPKAFDGPDYNANKEEKDPNKDYEYPYGDYDSGYDHKEYERIKELSEKQAAEIKQNPGNCKEVKKDDLTCVTCKDPKTGGNYESCSYVAEPKNNKYAYSKDKKFDSNDEPESDSEENSKAPPSKPTKYEDEKDEESTPKRYERSKEESNEDSGDKYKGYYTHTSSPKQREAIRSDEDSSEQKSDSLTKPYNYKEAIPGFYSDSNQKKDVEHVLAEFKKKDRSSCKKVHKNGMTCYQCVDKSGLKHEECMFVSESVPKRSHLAYQELKEFTSKPPTVDGNEGAESKTVTTNAPPHASYVVANPGYGKKIKKKRIDGSSSPTYKVATSVLPVVATPTQRSFRAKRSDESDAEARAEIIDETNIAPPEEFAGEHSRGAFWAETMPRYSAALGVSLPEFMLARSEHEASFDETVAGA